MTARYKIPLLVVGALFLLWGILGLIDLRNTPYHGFISSDYTVIEVEEGSPAASAGLRVGDRIISFSGIPVEDSRAFTRMSRPEIGETRMLVVVEAAATTSPAGEGESVTREVELTFGALPTRVVAQTWAAFIIGLCFIGFALLPYVKAPSWPAMLLALTGLCIGIALVGGPYIGSYALRAIVETISVLLVLFGCATLLHCLMEFPKPKAILGKRHATKVLYAPAVLTALFSLWLTVVVPRGTSTLNAVVNAIYSIFVVLYFGLALVALIHTFAKATRDQRSRYGLNLLLGGVIIGLVPTIIEALVTVVAPRVIIPGSDFLFVTAVLIPITMALAIMKVEGVPAAEPAPAM